METGFRIDAANGADHFAREQDVIDRHHPGEEIDPRLVISGERLVEGFWLGHWMRKRSIPANLLLFREIASMIRQGVLSSEIGRIYREAFGTHYPAMSMIFVSDLLDSPGKIELEATAVVPVST